MNFYNENDPAAAAWLRELIKQKQIPEGVVDERSIAEVQPTDLVGFTQAHFFAGIAGWSYALKLAGWPENRPVWTGSVPCQPFSAAGKGKADADERHLWPVFARLISKCRPDILFGEQVANAIGFGWFDGISADLERDGYAVGAAVLGSHSAGAPHIRQRLFWLANSTSARPLPGAHAGIHCGEKGGGSRDGESERCSESGRLADAGYDAIHLGPRLPGRSAGEREPERSLTGGSVEAGRVAHTKNSDGRSKLHEGGEESGRAELGGSGGMGDANQPGSQGRNLGWDGASERAPRPSGVGFWDRYELIPCRDGKARRVEPGTQPLVDGFPARVDLLRGYGNAICPWVAKEFIQAAEEALQAGGPDKAFLVA